MDETKVFDVKIRPESPCASSIYGKYCMPSQLVEKYNIEDYVEKCDGDVVCAIKKAGNNLIESYVKPTGPKDHQWLSNVNIEEVFLRWVNEFDFFYPCKFAMSDIYNYNNELASIDLKKLFDGEHTLYMGNNKAKRKIKCFACIVNTDVHTGNGEHWTAIFVDTRTVPISIEYFNSVAEPPCKNITKWMLETKKQLNGQIVYVNKIDHQLENSECGVYSLYYVRARLEGKPYTFFMEEPIRDSVIYKFRRYLFR